MDNLLEEERDIDELAEMNDPEILLDMVNELEPEEADNMSFDEETNEKENKL